MRTAPKLNWTPTAPTQQHRYSERFNGVLLYTLGIAGQTINKQSEVRYAISVVRLPTAYLRGLWEACFKCHLSGKGGSPHALTARMLKSAAWGVGAQVCLQLKGFPRYSGSRQKSCGAACNLTCTLKAIRSKRASQ